MVRAGGFIRGLTEIRERRAAGNWVDRQRAFSSGSVCVCVGFTFGAAVG